MTFLDWYRHFNKKMTFLDWYRHFNNNMTFTNPRKSSFY
jgi:hypothetical protein